MKSIQDDPGHVKNYKGPCLQRFQYTNHPQDKKLFSEAINDPILKVSLDLVVVGLQTANLVLELLQQPQLFGCYDYDWFGVPFLLLKR